MSTGESAKVCLEFGQNGYYNVKCGDNTKTFDSIEGFSEELKDGIASNFFGSTSVVRNSNTIKFNGVHNNIVIL